MAHSFMEHALRVQRTAVVEARAIDTGCHKRPPFHPNGFTQLVDPRQSSRLRAALRSKKQPKNGALQAL